MGAEEPGDPAAEVGGRADAPGGGAEPRGERRVGSRDDRPSAGSRSGLGGSLPGEPREIHGFVLRKAAKIHDHLAESRTVGEGHFHHPVAVNEEELREVHTPDLIARRSIGRDSAVFFRLPRVGILFARSAMKRESLFWHMLGVAFMGAFLTAGVVFAQGDFFVEGMKLHDGGRGDISLWESDLAAKVCELDSLTLLHGQAEQVERDATGQPVSCAKGVIAKLAHSTRVHEITPSDSCNTRHPPGTYRRVRVLDGPHAGKIGCIISSALAGKALP